LCFTSLTQWHVEHVSTYFLTFLFMLFQKYFLLSRLKILWCSKWSTYKSSWFCFRSFFLRNFEKMYHLFFQRNKSFSMFHLNDESRSTFSRLLFDTTSSSFFESKRFALSFFLSCFIDAFSIKNRIRCAKRSDCCRINNTMRSFKNEALNVVFLFDIFYSIFRSKIFAIRDVFESKFSRNLFDVSRRWFERFFFLQNSFHSRNDFLLLQEVLCVFSDWDFCTYFEIIARETVAFRFFVDCFQNFWRIVICIRQNELSMTCRLREVCTLFLFIFARENVFAFDQDSFFEI
jgi:hypothetical protein